MQTQNDSDLLYGAAAVAQFLGLREAQVRHLMRKNKIPHFKISSTLCARRSSLRDWLATQGATGSTESGSHG